MLLDGDLAQLPDLMTQTSSNMYILMPWSEYQDVLSCKVNIDQHVQCIFSFGSICLFLLKSISTYSYIAEKFVS